jgi:disulfide bond formation protein DsbB
MLIGYKKTWYSYNMETIKKNLLYAAWALSLIGMLGSLYFSEVLKLPPCVLCWYQRICMYPLVVILGVGILRRDRGVALYALPLSLVGFGIAIYHNLLYFNILPEALAPCTAGVSCTTKQIELLGSSLLTIPFLSLVGFLLINILLVAYQLTIKNDDQRS